MKKRNRKALKKELWKVFSLYIRNRGAVDGWNKCVTCGAMKRVEEMDAGHFRHGTSSESWLDERNVHAQCKRCNGPLNGNLIEYTLFMQDEYGDSVIDELKALKRKPKYWKIGEMEELIKKYKS